MTDRFRMQTSDYPVLDRQPETQAFIYLVVTSVQDPLMLDVLAHTTAPYSELLPKLVPQQLFGPVLIDHGRLARQAPPQGALGPREGRKDQSARSLDQITAKGRELSRGHLSKRGRLFNGFLKT